ncbi:hypothetical protein GUITHDRAFT_103654 [Guillardia theta CCMP2712]|uniref:Uncharacterized protein n=1 Tax=Guillardia theta (strain CCMP2712) TaxID=905079 RepID=L1JQG0_GUITC|nr:hypothetical protein GUITHDRAFT_103654 [Guillardia theta CCMP2712]EKX50420.1 hypothetical protein GUITHDRAFT_103654 [Guillardia theta CCMP2712]|eukprot:XP_005837400.1 hypothetical protein GUITHDRAFT_103654 [Guillardia theta CCMP2712]
MQTPSNHSIPCSFPLHSDLFHFALAVENNRAATDARARNLNGSRHRVLNAEVAKKIFKEKALCQGNKSVESELVARCYGVSAKTVRDIWDKRSWAKVTDALETREARDDTSASASSSGKASSEDDAGQTQRERSAEIENPVERTTEQEGSSSSSSGGSERAMSMSSYAASLTQAGGSDSIQPEDHGSEGSNNLASADNNSESMGEESEESEMSEGSFGQSSGSSDYRSEWYVQPSMSCIEDFMQSTSSSGNTCNSPE